MALPQKLIGPTISSITGLITSTSMSFVGLALNYGFHPDFAVRWLNRSDQLRPDRADVDPRHPANPALRHAPSRIADTLRSDRRILRRKPRPKRSRSGLHPGFVLTHKPSCELDGSRDAGMGLAPLDWDAALTVLIGVGLRRRSGSRAIDLPSDAGSVLALQLFF
jgi:hypothetical protein